MTSTENWPWWLIGFLAAIDLVVRVLAIIYIPRNRRPTAAMAWLLDTWKA